MDRFEKLMKAAIEGKAQEIEGLAEDVLCKKNQQENSCLHIASMCGHEAFCKEVLRQQSSLPSVSSLLSHTNNDNETPLLVAVKSGRDSLAHVLLDKYSTKELKEALLTKDKHGCSVLHHAIRNGYENLAVKLIDQQEALAADSNNDQESPMFIAVLRGFKKVYMKLLDIDTSTYTGPNSSNALHVAVKYDEIDFVKGLVAKHPVRAKDLAKEEDMKNDSPMQLIADFNRVDILKEMLRCDRSLGYQISGHIGNPLLCAAAFWGHVAVARVLLEHCPDAPYHDTHGRTCLHEAVENERIEFIEFILQENSKLRKLVNMKDNAGDTALHYAVRKCNPKMVGALLNHRDIDVSVINKLNCAAIWSLSHYANYAKTINWHKICLLILKADPRAKVDISNLHEAMRNKVMDASRKDVRLLIQTYTGNTSLVAILISTITFAAAFTLPGGYSSNAGSEGLPIMAKNIAFQAFLIFDTLAMCSSLAVAFICVIARWSDFEFLVHYRSWTKKLMWFAYMATTISFATGLYTVLASRVHWLAIGICVISVSLPILTRLIGEWPILKLKIRCPKPTLTSDFLDMV